MCKKFLVGHVLLMFESHYLILGSQLALLRNQSHRHSVVTLSLNLFSANLGQNSQGLHLSPKEVFYPNFRQKEQMSMFYRKLKWPLAEHSQEYVNWKKSELFLLFMRF